MGTQSERIELGQKKEQVNDVFQNCNNIRKFYSYPSPPALYELLRIS